MAEPTTSTMNISLPEQLKRYVDSKVASGMYGSASEFVREAIREKMKQEEELERAKAILAAKILEGLGSGEPIEVDDDYFARRKRLFEERVRSMKRSA
jgi:antitoxin ParD1/3/4